MKILSCDLPSPIDSEKLASQLANCLTAPAVLTFSGEIGAGKTTFIRAMLRALGIVSAIKSPTFSLVESYQCSSLLIHHFDLYRIHEETELEYIGFRDYFGDQSICCIEWPERIHDQRFRVDLHCVLTLNGEGRLMCINALSELGEKLLSRLADKK